MREIQVLMGISSLDNFKKYAKVKELNKKGHKIITNLLKNNPDWDC